MSDINFTFDDYDNFIPNFSNILCELIQLYLTVDENYDNNLNDKTVLKIMDRYLTEMLLKNINLNVNSLRKPAIFHNTYVIYSYFVNESVKARIKQFRHQSYSVGCFYFGINYTKYYDLFRNIIINIVTNFGKLKEATNTSDKQKYAKEITSSYISYLLNTLFTRTNSSLELSIENYLQKNYKSTVYYKQLYREIFKGLDVSDIVASNNSNNNSNNNSENPLLLNNSQMPNNNTNMPINTVSKNYNLSEPKKVTNNSGECYDPLMASYSTIKNESESTIFYVMNNSGVIIKTYCLDNDSLEGMLKNNDNVFYRCKDTVPVTATMITTGSVMPQRLRKLAYDVILYVNENQAKKIVPGKRYILQPSDVAVGRIASYNVVKGHEIVSREHCQNNYKNDFVYDIKEYSSSISGENNGTIISGGKRHRKTKKNKRSKRKSSKLRKH